MTHPAASPDASVRHVRLLAVLHLVWGASWLLLGAALLLLAAGAASLVESAGRQDAGFEARVTAATLALLGGLLVAGGLALVWVGRGLARHRPRARTGALVLAAPNLVVLPFGTALGLYAFWVLLGEAARRLFEPERA